MSATSKPAKGAPRSGPAQGAYSKLTELMRARSLTVIDFHKTLTERGHRFDLKAIYRLASDKPLMNISAPVVRAVCETLNIDLGKLIVWQPPAPKLQRIDAKTQKRLDYLMARSNEGELTDAERTELERFAVELEALSIKNAKLLARHARPDRRSNSPGQRAQTPKPLAV
jgi:Cro/C1-type HTH DNA-binding domain